MLWPFLPATSSPTHAFNSITVYFTHATSYTTYYLMLILDHCVGSVHTIHMPNNHVVLAAFGCYFWAFRFFPMKACLIVSYGRIAWDQILACQPTTSLSSWHKYPSSSLNNMSVCILLQWDTLFALHCWAWTFVHILQFNVLDILSPTPLHFRRRLFTSSCLLATDNVIIDMLTYRRWRRDGMPFQKDLVENSKIVLWTLEQSRMTNHIRCT
jgi:hypothetical protein